MTDREKRVRVSRRVTRGFDRIKLRQLREDAGMTRGDLARKADVSSSAIASWESGRGGPQVDTLARVAKQLGVRIDVLVPIPAEQRYLGDLRVLRGLTQPQLAAAAGISTTQLGALERGEVTLTHDVAGRLADALTVSPSEVEAGWRRARARPAGQPA